MTLPVQVLPDPQGAARAAADVVRRAAQDAVRERGRFSIALSGGTTPAMMYEDLATNTDRPVPWNVTDVFFTDERCVPPTHAESNYALAKRALIDPLGLDSARVHRLRGEVKDHVGEAQRAEADLLAYSPDGGVDIALLGLGPDGHVASLFPRTPGLDVSDRFIVANPAGLAPFVPRLTWTFAALAKARFVLILCTGAAKADVLWRAAGLRDSHLPVSRVRSASGPPMIIADRAAAARLDAQGGEPR